MVRGWFIAAIIVTGLIATAQWLLFRPEPISVRVLIVDRGIVEETVTSTRAGSIRSRQLAELSLETAGTVATLHVREGRRVRRGDPLVSIDAREADAALQSARRELAVLEALVAEALARENEAGRDLRRAIELRKSESISESELDQARTKHEVSVTTRQAAEARREAQEAAIDRAVVVREKCDLRAPFDGVVAEVYVEAGEWAVPGKVAVKLLDPDRIYVSAELDEVDLAAVRPGLEARVTLDPYRDRRLVGRIVRVAPYVSEIEEQNRTVEIEVELPEALEGLRLLPGTSADVEVILRSVADVVRVPRGSLLEGDRVLLADPSGLARSVPVRVGLKNWEYAEVREGLRGGERLIVSLESERLRDGARVRVAEEKRP